MFNRDPSLEPVVYLSDMIDGITGMYNQDYKRRLVNLPDSLQTKVTTFFCLIDEMYREVENLGRSWREVNIPVNPEVHPELQDIDLCTAYYREAMAHATEEQITEMIRAMPGGYFRTELRVRLRNLQEQKTERLGPLEPA